MIQHPGAPCGINCSLCHAFQRGNCPGCRQKPQEVRKSCAGCVILKCSKQHRYCYECDKPCKRLKTLHERYRTRYGVDLSNNLNVIRESGEEAFLARQREIYTCPVCGNSRTVHYDYCVYCKTGKRK